MEKAICLYFAGTDDYFLKCNAPFYIFTGILRVYNSDMTINTNGWIVNNSTEMQKIFIIQ